MQLYKYSTLKSWILVKPLLRMGHFSDFSAIKTQEVSTDWNYDYIWKNQKNPKPKKLEQKIFLLSENPKTI